MKKVILILSILWLYFTTYSQNSHCLDYIFEYKSSFGDKEIQSERKKYIMPDSIDIDSLFECCLNTNSYKEGLLYYQKPILFYNIDSLLYHYFEKFDKSLEKDGIVLTNDDYAFFGLFNKLAKCKYIQYHYALIYDITPTSVYNMKRWYNTNIDCLNLDSLNRILLIDYYNAVCSFLDICHDDKILIDSILLSEYERLYDNILIKNCNNKTDIDFCK